MLGTLLTPEKSTVTNLICTHGGQDRDWTADYRLYSKHRVDESHLFDQARDSLLENLAPGQPLVVASLGNATLPAGDPRRFAKAVEEPINGHNGLLDGALTAEAAAWVVRVASLAQRPKGGHPVRRRDR